MGEKFIKPQIYNRMTSKAIWLDLYYSGLEKKFSEIEASLVSQYTHIASKNVTWALKNLSNAQRLKGSGNSSARRYRVDKTCRVHPDVTIEELEA